MNVLNQELFDRDPKHEAYWAAASHVLERADRDTIPVIARQMAMNHLQHMLSLMEGGDFDRWMSDLIESFADGYVLASEEDWGLDRDVVETLINDCMFEVNKSRLAVGSDAITRDDFSTWISVVLLGLHSDLDEWSSLNSYVLSTGALERLESIFSTYLTVAEIAGPSSRASDDWRRANLMAWRDGIFLVVLGGLGFLSAEAGGRSFTTGERPLSGTLFELDPEQYVATAARVTQATAQAVPEIAKELFWYVGFPSLTEKLARKYGGWFQDIFECGYVLCVSETWDGLDEAKFKGLLLEGLRKDLGSAVLALSPEELATTRFREMAVGVTTAAFSDPSLRSDYFEALDAFLDEQEAMDRLKILGQLMVEGFLHSGAVTNRQMRKVAAPLRQSYMSGVGLGLLDQLELLPVTPIPDG